jgi:ABC-type multidrug transport system fused ATPase/permease subunit
LLTEESILRSFDQLKNEKTIISVAHRLSTVKDADTILVVDNGMIAEYGTHDELVAKQGIYHKFYSNEQLEDGDSLDEKHKIIY